MRNQYGNYSQSITERYYERLVEFERICGFVYGRVCEQRKESRRKRKQRQAFIFYRWFVCSAFCPERGVSLERWDDVFNDDAGGVDAEIIAAAVAPIVGAEDGMDLGAVFIDLADFLFIVFVGVIDAVGFSMAAALDACGKIGVDENAQRIMLAQDQIGIAADDDAVALAGQLLNQRGLLLQQSGGMFGQIVGQHRQRLTDGDRVEI